MRHCLGEHNKKNGHIFCYQASEVTVMGGQLKIGYMFDIYTGSFFSPKTWLLFFLLFLLDPISSVLKH